VRDNEKKPSDDRAERQQEEKAAQIDQKSSCDGPENDE
jgi:hypothetical protein